MIENFSNLSFWRNCVDLIPGRQVRKGPVWNMGAERTRKMEQTLREERLRLQRLPHSAWATIPLWITFATIIPSSTSSSPWTQNALLKLVKWNQINCLMDLVPFNQL